MNKRNISVIKGGFILSMKTGKFLKFTQSFLNQYYIPVLYLDSLKMFLLLKLQIIKGKSHILSNYREMGPN